jgi:hypothetical protein
VELIMLQSCAADASACYGPQFLDDGVQTLRMTFPVVQVDPLARPEA